MASIQLDVLHNTNHFTECGLGGSSVPLALMKLPSNLLDQKEKKEKVPATERRGIFERGGVEFNYLFPTGG